MIQTALATTPTAVRRPAEDPPSSRLGRSRMRQSRIIGALFLAGFLLYGSGSSLVTALVGGPGFLTRIASVGTLLALGAFLMLLNTAVDLTKAVLFFPILERHSKRTALTYFATLIVQVVFMTLGALAILLLVPLAQHAGDPGARTVGMTLVQLNLMAYQIGQMTLGVGATFLCVVLFRAGLVPRWLALSGLIGYPLHVLGTVAEVFGVHIGLYLTMPGFFFELALPVWLLIRGFRREAYEGKTVAVPGA